MQVKRYIDIYSASSMIGFSSVDVSLLSNAYVKAQKMFLKAMNALASQSDPGDTIVTHLKSSIDAHAEFLAQVSELARSKWTEFNLGMMGFGLGIMLLSLLFQYFAIRRVIKLFGTTSYKVSGGCGISFGSLFACFLVAIHAMSLLSNSYLVEEAKVATFLLATAVFIKFKHSMAKMKMSCEAAAFLFLILVLRFAIYVGLSKQAGVTTSLSSRSWIIVINEAYSTTAAEVIPFVALILLAYLLYRTISSGMILSISKAIVVGAISCYVLIAVHWASESGISNLASKTTARTLIPRIIYTIGLGELLLLAFGKLGEAQAPDCRESLLDRTVCMLSTWSSTVILLSGRQGPLIALASIIGGYCIVKLQNAGEDNGVSAIVDPLSVVEWSLLAVIMLFSTGHWCAFDGLHYGAAFVGFDEFALVCQAILLTIETYGFSHIIPIFGLPFLVLGNNLISCTKQPRKLVTLCLTQVYLMYGLIMATTVTVTIICVTIQRRHLMVWALFAPKFVFDVVGLILADILICFASLYYHLHDGIKRPQGPASKS
ncbi:hypothetical protein MLD38_017910 [Melastoma candidum]|uniref:Uncharacterized protein n=1 Tax=Melastoma candidum TaxID=119954 RepID=A0ACB9QTA3_9MYRT|nr:hypothetical protein MLD38_017910 [Melastoma candidum]